MSRATYDPHRLVVAYRGERLSFNGARRITRTLSVTPVRSPWDRRALDPKWWSKDKARGTAADTAGAIRREERELTSTRRSYGGEW